MPLSNKLTKTVAIVAVSVAVSLAASQTWAAGVHGDGHGGGAKSSTGKQGNISEVTRTIEIKMFDNYYEPENLNIKKGETIRFAIKNMGDYVHEFNIGTASMHEAHQQEMVLMMEHGALEVDKINYDLMKMDMGNGVTMEHNDPNSVLLEPGKTGEVIWKFTNKSALQFACNVPGHYESGMAGELSFK
ncbi:MAG: cupredoxin domain-containing protein [Magnetovibrio sp.]|nr:cupredoxin domain-containing protein [Magnetovibrio sp.]